MLRKNGLGNATISAQRQMQHDDLICDEDINVVEQMEQPSSTVDKMQLEENGVIYSIISEETEDVEQPDDSSSAIGIDIGTNNDCVNDNGNSAMGIYVDTSNDHVSENGNSAMETDVDTNNDRISDNGNSAMGIDVDANDDCISIPLDMDGVVYEQGELHETAKELEGRQEEAFSSNTVDKDVNCGKDQRESESVSNKQDLEQIESAQSSQPVSSSSSSYNTNPAGSRKGTRVSVYRELDINYEQSNADNGNVRLYHVM